MCKENMEANFRDYQRDINIGCLKHNIPTDLELSIYILDLFISSGKVSEIVRKHLEGNYNLYHCHDRDKIEELKSSLADLLISLTLVSSHFAIALDTLAKEGIKSIDDKHTQGKQNDEL